MPCTDVQPMQVNVCKRLAPSPGHESAAAVQFDSFVPHIFLHYTQRAVDAVRTYVLTYAQTVHPCLPEKSHLCGWQQARLSCLPGLYKRNTRSTNNTYVIGNPKVSVHKIKMV